MKKQKKNILKTSPIHYRNIINYRHQNTSVQSKQQNIKKGSKEKTLKVCASQMKIGKIQEFNKQKKILQDKNNIPKSKNSLNNNNKQNIQSHHHDKQKNQKNKNFESKQHPTCISIFKNIEAYDNLKQQTEHQIDIQNRQQYSSYKQHYYNTLKQMNLRKSESMDKTKKDKILHTQNYEVQKNNIHNNYTKTLVELNNSHSFQQEKKVQIHKHPINNINHAAKNSSNNIIKILKCAFHSQKQAKYLVELNNNQDVLCCQQCGNQLSQQGYSLQQISNLKSKRMYDIDQFLQKSLKCMNNLKKGMQYLPEHYKNILNQLHIQMDAHDQYYNQLIEVINRKKQHTKNILRTTENNISQYFQKAYLYLHQHYVGAQSGYNQIMIHRQDIKKMNQLDFIKIMKEYQKRLIIQQNSLKTKLDIWKIQVGDIRQFQKDFQKYVIKVQQNERLNQVLSNSTCQLLCQQQFEWGYTLKPNKDTNKRQNNNLQIYFSFQKKDKNKQNEIINCDQQQQQQQLTQSPSFKKN